MDKQKTDQIHIRVDEVFRRKLEYLMRLNGWKNISETIRKVIEKEYRRETDGRG